MDTTVEGGVKNSIVIRRALVFLGWLLAFFTMTLIVGMLPTVFIFVVMYMRIEGKEGWPLVASIATGLTLFSYFLFDHLLHVSWPESYLGDLFPALRAFSPIL